MTRAEIDSYANIAEASVVKVVLLEIATFILSYMVTLLEAKSLSGLLKVLEPYK